jgi:hypothetical protein
MSAWVTATRLSAPLLFMLAVPTVGMLGATQLGAQAPTAEAPVLRPGEFWIFRWEEDWRGKREGTFTRTVVRKDVFEGQEVYVLSRGDGTFDVVDRDRVTIARIDGAGNVRVRFVQKGDPVFPLFVGKVYTREFDTPVGRYRGTYRYTVTAVEEVSTKSGTFAAFRVSWEGRGTFYDGTPFTAQGVQHFAPSTKAWVKSSFRVDTGYQYGNELVRYQVLPD